MTDWLEQITTIYRDAVRDLSQAGDSADRKSAFAFATEQITDLVRNEELVIPLDDVINSALVKVDEKDGSATDTAIKSFALGQFNLVIDNDPILDMVVTLGGGKRKLWRNFTVDDLIELDRLRYRNVASVQTAYEEWRESFDALLPALLSAASIGDLAKKSSSVPA